MTNKSVHPELEHITGLSFVTQADDEKRVASAVELLADMPGFGDSFITDDERKAAATALISIIDSTTAHAMDRIVDYHNSVKSEHAQLMTVMLCLELFCSFERQFSGFAEQVTQASATLMTETVSKLPPAQQEAAMRRAHDHISDMLRRMMGGK